jgi:hypothetical protein
MARLLFQVFFDRGYPENLIFPLNRRGDSPIAPAVAHHRLLIHSPLIIGFNENNIVAVSLIESCSRDDVTSVRALLN